MGYNSAKSSLSVVASGIKKINVARAFYASKSENLSFNFRRKRISRGFYYIYLAVVRENDGKCIQICFLFKCLFYGVDSEDQNSNATTKWCSSIFEPKNGLLPKRSYVELVRDVSEQ